MQSLGLIWAERIRQIRKEGYTEELDDRWQDGGRGSMSTPFLVAGL